MPSRLHNNNIGLMVLIVIYV